MSYNKAIKVMRYTRRFWYGVQCDLLVQCGTPYCRRYANIGGLMEITKNECYQCLYECMEESLPKGWKTAWVDAEIQGDEISVSYFYTSGIFRKKSKFLTKNTFAPPNAMNAIHDIMRNEGNPWSMAQFKIYKDGKIEFKRVA